MKFLEGDVASCYCVETLSAYINELLLLIKQNPSIIENNDGIEDRTRETLENRRIQYYPTVKSTTLFYMKQADCFIKILHPLTLKNKILFHLLDKARQIYSLSESLVSTGIKVARVDAYGTFRQGRKPFFVIKRVEGISLYDLLIREREVLSKETYLNVLNEIIRLHSLGYWLGDAHLSHIFIKDNNVSGLIDVDSIRKNRPYSVKNLAKDIAGLNHPALPVDKDEKKELLHYYIQKMRIGREAKFLKLLRYYSEKRWKE